MISVILAATVGTGITLTGVVTVVVGVFAVIAALAAAVAYFRSNLSQQTIKLLQQNKDAQDARITELEKEKDEQAVVIAEQKARIDVLESLASGKEAVRLLADVVSTHHDEMIAEIRKLQVKS